MKRIAAVSLCLVTSVILTAGPVMAADPSGAGPASVTGGPSNVGVVIRTPAEQTFFELKSKIVADYALVRAGTLGRSAFALENQAFLAQYGDVTANDIATQFATQIANAKVAPMATSGTLNMTESPQATSYYCGAAAVYEILSYLGVTSGPANETLTQAHLAGTCSSGYLCTDHLGETPWYYYSGYPHPVLSTLNTWKHPMWYAISSGATNYVSWLTYDVDYHYPLVVGIDEAANASTPHLVGHPTNIVISHWISASGYRNSGSDTYYADSVHGTSFWSWSKNVPAFSWLPSGNTGMSYLMRLSGYIG